MSQHFGTILCKSIDCYTGMVDAITKHLLTEEVAVAMVGFVSDVIYVSNARRLSTSIVFLVNSVKDAEKALEKFSKVYLDFAENDRTIKNFCEDVELIIKENS